MTGQFVVKLDEIIPTHAMRSDPGKFVIRGSGLDGATVAFDKTSVAIEFAKCGAKETLTGDVPKWNTSGDVDVIVTPPAPGLPQSLQFHFDESCS
jgi:hypothetical protein